MLNSKKQVIIDTARELFWKHGLQKIHIEEICRKAGVSKMTFYRYFKNKNDLIKTVIESFYRPALDAYCSIFDKSIPFSEKAKQMMALKMEQTDSLSQEAMDDLYLYPDPELSQFMNEKVEEILGIIAGKIKEAQAKGEIRPDVKPEFILFFFNKMYDFVKDENLTRLYDTPQALIMELYRFFFYGIIAKEGHEN
jgi:AcrR family transcriptional regulator